MASWTLLQFTAVSKPAMRHHTNPLNLVILESVTGHRSLVQRNSHRQTVARSWGAYAGDDDSRKKGRMAYSANVSATTAAVTGRIIIIVTQSVRKAGNGPNASAKQKFRNLNITVGKDEARCGSESIPRDRLYS